MRKKAFAFSVLALIALASCHNATSQTIASSESEASSCVAPANRNIIVAVAANEQNYDGTDKHGNRWYAKTAGGKQYWVQVRNGVIRNCGCNEPPRLDDQ